MLIDYNQCGIHLLSLIDDAINNASDINVAMLVNVDSQTVQDVEVGLKKLQKAARGMMKILIQKINQKYRSEKSFVFSADKNFQKSRTKTFQFISVIFLCVGENGIDGSQKVLKIANNLGMTTSEYIYLIPSLIQNFETSQPWISSNTDTISARDEFEYVLIVSNLKIKLEKTFLKS